MLEEIGIRLRRIAIPALLFVATIQFYLHLAQLPDSLQLVMRWLPFAILSVATVLATVYHKYATSSCVIITIGLYAAYLQFANNTEVASPRALVFYLSAVYPLIFWASNFIPNKPMWQPLNLVLIVAILTLTQAGYIEQSHAVIASIWQFLPEYFTKPAFTASFMPNISLLIYAVISIWALVHYLIKPSHQGGVLAVAIPASAALWLVHDPLVKLNAIPLLGPVIFIGIAVAMIAAITIESYAMAYRDELTSIAGRRALMSKFNHLGKNFVIAMVDVDHFKRFNDTYGHDIGDEVLKMVAKRLSAVRHGKAYRYGGEEFALVFNNRELEQAVPILEDLRRSISNYAFVFRDQRSRPRSDKRGAENRHEADKKRSVRVTVSIGAAMPNFAIRDPIAVMKMADEALYHAKESGRNCVKT